MQSAPSAIAAQTPAAQPAMEAILVSPASGPAFFNSVSPFPGSVALYGIDVMSPDDDGVRLVANETLTMLLVNANENGKNGFRLTTSSDGGIGVEGCTASWNGAAGMTLDSAAEVSVFNSLADDNMDSGMDILAVDEVSIFSFPVDSLPGLIFPSVVSASRNKSIGIVATSTTSTVIIVDFFALTVGESTFGDKTIVVENNQGTGAQLSSDDNTTIAGAAFNGNKGFGIESNAMTDVFLFSVLANGNDADGITLGAEFLTAIFTAANDNGGNGLGASLGGMDNNSNGVFDNAAGLVSCSADGNQQRGFSLTVPNGTAVVTGCNAIGNHTEGIVLSVLAGGANRVDGGIICSNQISGLHLTSNATVDATGNWWGDPSGPFHATKNPGGLGNQVIDGTSGGGLGDVTFLPVIDTVTGSVSGPVQLGQPSPVQFQFSGGAGTVFLGPSLGPLFPIFITIGPGALPPFTVTTDNGIVKGLDSGVSAKTFVNQPQGVARVNLLALRKGPATVQIDGPCGLSGSLDVNVVSALVAPAMSWPGLLAALLIVSAIAGAGIRRRRDL